MSADERARRIAEAIRRTNPDAAAKYLRGANRRAQIEQAAREEKEIGDHGSDD